MKLTQLIDQLSKFHATFGDADVALQTIERRGTFCGEHMTVTNVEYRNPAPPTDTPPFAFPLVVLRTGTVKDE